MVYIRPEMEVTAVEPTHLLATSNELGMDSEHQGDESVDFGQKRNNNRGEWGNLWGD